ncbi:MAG: bifunctional adenosylcobinamide kinase/adenosylcobinamide-phosphate guanylyltransferase [Chloroflexota bacterium]
MAKQLIFLLGGARSGKSNYAENWAKEHSENVLFVATAQAFDDEMTARIINHRASRPTTWDTLEVPTNVGEAIAQQPNHYDTILVDCLTLLASNILLKLPEDATSTDAETVILQEVDALLDAHQQSDATWLIISNEVGMGLVPPYRLGRLYRDALGRANQRIARVSDQVLLLVAGLPWQLHKQT